MLGLLALVLALNAPHIVEYIRLGFMIRTPVAITVLLGLYWRGANATGAAAAIIVGTLAVLGWQTSAIRGPSIRSGSPHPSRWWRSSSARCWAGPGRQRT